MRRSEEAGDHEYALFAPVFGGDVIALHCAVGGGRTRYQWWSDCRCLWFQWLGKKSRANRWHEPTKVQ